MNNQKINYNKMMEDEIEKVKKRGEKSKLLLQVCCAPCSSHVIDLLKQDFDITAFYYNPNIYPQNEFYKRKVEVEKLLVFMGLDEKKLIMPEYDQTEFYNAVRGVRCVLTLE